MAKYRVVSIDGGGIRGLIPTILLQRIIATPGMGNVLDSVDLIAGTSTGGLLALGIAHELDLSAFGTWIKTDGQIPKEAIVAVMAKGEVWDMSNPGRSRWQPYQCLRFKVGENGRRIQIDWWD